MSDRPGSAVDYKPISHYGVIGDMHTAALVALDGSIDWFCAPRFYSPSVFAALLDVRKGGKFQLSPTENSTTKQSYEGDTNVLSTIFESKEGKIKLTDFMPCFMEKGEAKGFQELHQNSVLLETLGRAREVPGTLPCQCRKIMPCPEAIEVCSNWSYGCSSHDLSPRECWHSKKLGLSILLDQRQRALGYCVE